MTPAEALEWAKLGLTVGQWLLGMILRLADAGSAEDAKRASDVIPSPLKSMAALAADRIKAQREIAAAVFPITVDHADVLETARRLEAMDWPDADRWARALYGLEEPPIVSIPANPFGDDG